jgi:4-amino-4-deoxy-L-arabinose transferase-like glycosyltransferase
MTPAGPPTVHGRGKANNPTDKEEIIVEAAGAAKHRIYWLAILLAISAIAFFFGLGKLALLGPDEPRYAEVAREMLVSDDYISPRLCGCLWFEKPALLYWLAAAAYKILGVGELAARLPSAVSALVVMIFLFRTIAQRLSTAAAFLACLIMITNPIFVGYARAAVPDMLLTATISVAFLSVFLAATSAGRARAGYWILACAAAGAAALAKGLVGPIIFVVVLGGVGALNPGARFIRVREIALGVAAFLAVASVWYLPVTTRHGREFIDEFFVNHHFKRYLTDTYHHPQPVYFFLIILIAGVFPWTFLLVPAIWRLRLSWLRSATPRSLLLSLAWMWLIVCLVFFSFSVSKLPGYVLPAFPALAIILGMEAELIWNRKIGRGVTAVRLGTALSMVLLALVFVIPAYLPGVAPEKVSRSIQPFLDTEPGRIAIWIPLVLAAAALVGYLSGKVRMLLLGPAAVFTSVLACGIAFMPASLSETFGLKSLSVQAANELRPGEKIAFYIDKEYAPVFYAQGRVVCGPGIGDVLDALSPNDIASTVKAEGSLIVITTQNWESGLETDERLQTDLIGRQGRALALRVTLQPGGPSP